MENLKQKLSEDQKNALRAGDKVRVSVLRMLLSAIANKEIAVRRKDVGLSGEEVAEVIASEAKKRRDAALEFKKGSRDDLAQKEEEELIVLSEYLPPEISDEELLRILRDGMREVDAKTERDLGKVMKVVMPLLKGKASGGRITEALKKELHGGI